MITFAFSGQGAQKAGMAGSLFQKYGDRVKSADRILGYSVEDLCQSSDGRLNQTEYTQPAIFVVNALYLFAALERLGRPPDYMVGHSVGELSALYAAGAYDFETGLEIVKARGALMSKCKPEGAMVALIGERTRLLEIIGEARHGVYLANDNGPNQVVVAGTKQNLEKFTERLGQLGVAHAVPLPVSGAFHSPLMKDAKDAFAEYLARQTFSKLTIPVVANVSARPYLSSNVSHYLTEHMVSPVRWFGSISFLTSTGPMLFQDIGPPGLISSLVRQAYEAEFPFDGKGDVHF